METAKMFTKSIRLTKEDNIGLADIMNKHPRVERGPSEALRICFEEAALNIPEWEKVIKKAQKLDYSENISFEGGATKTFLVAEDTFATVLNSINEQLGTIKPRISYMTRLCIYNTRLKLYPEIDYDDVKRVSEKVKILVGEGASEVMDIERFRELSIDDKLIEIYKILIG